MKALGFKNVRIETYEMPAWSRVSESAAIVAPFPQALRVTALGNSVSTPDGGVTAEVARFATLTDLKNAPLTGLEGKIVFVDEKMTRTQDGSGYGVAVAKRSEATVEAAKRGALAAVIRSVGTDSHRNPHTGMMRAGESDRKKAARALATRSRAGGTRLRCEISSSCWASRRRSTALTTSKRMRSSARRVRLSSRARRASASSRAARRRASWSGRFTSMPTTGFSGSSCQVVS